jgi:hypothetical protein
VKIEKSRRVVELRPVRLDLYTAANDELSNIKIIQNDDDLFSVNHTGCGCQN